MMAPDLKMMRAEETAESTMEIAGSDPDRTRNPSGPSVPSLAQQIEQLRLEIELERKNAHAAEERAKIAEQRGDHAEQLIALQCELASLSRINALFDQIADLAKEGTALADERTARVEERIARTDLRERTYDFILKFPRLHPTLEKLLEEFKLFEVNGLIETTTQAPPTNSYAPGWQLSNVYSDPFICDDSGFDIRTWRITEETMLDQIQRKLCNGNGNAANDLVSKCEEAVRKLRDMFAWIQIWRNNIHEKDDFQPIFILLLEYIIQSLTHHNSSDGQNLLVSPARGVHLEGTVQRLPQVGGSCELMKILWGTSDIAVFHGSNVDLITSWLFNVEIKSPSAFRPLIHAKHQLIGQLEAIAQMRNDNKPVLGCLTDLEGITISLRLPGSSMELNDRVFFNTAIVTDPRQYSIRLLFLFCGFNKEELVALTKESTEGDLDDGDTSVQGEFSRSVLNKRSRDGNIYILLNDDSDDEEWEQLRGVNMWDARRRGVTYLCQEILDTLQHELLARYIRLKESEYLVV